MQLILELLLANKDNLPLPEFIVDILIEIYELVVELLNVFKYPFGFNLYVSRDGLDFEPVFLDGLDNRYNYGGRILYVDSEDDLYIGTANPYQGLEVWKAFKCKYNCCNNNNEYDFEAIKEELEKRFIKLRPYKSQIQEFLQPMFTRYNFRK